MEQDQSYYFKIIYVSVMSRTATETIPISSYIRIINPLINKNNIINFWFDIQSCHRVNLSFI